MGPWHYEVFARQDFWPENVCIPPILESWLCRCTTHRLTSRIVRKRQQQVYKINIKSLGVKETRAKINQPVNQTADSCTNFPALCCHAFSCFCVTSGATTAAAAEQLLESPVNTFLNIGFGLIRFAGFATASKMAESLKTEAFDDELTSSNDLSFTLSFVVLFPFVGGEGFCWRGWVIERVIAERPTNEVFPLRCLLTVHWAFGVRRGRGFTRSEAWKLFGVHEKGADKELARCSVEASKLFKWFGELIDRVDWTELLFLLGETDSDVTTICNKTKTI